MCDHKEMYIGKTVGDNVVSFKSRINQHISDCGTGTSNYKFLIHVHYRAMKNKYLKELYFQLNKIMKLKDSRQLEFYESHFHENGYDSSNCSEYLKKHLHTLS